MRVIPAALQIELDRLDQQGIWTRLYELELGDGTTYYRTEHHESITLGPNTYTPYLIVVESREDTAEAAFRNFNVVVANVDRDFLSQLENGLILGEKLTITEVFIDDENTPTAAFSETYEVINFELDDSRAMIIFSVGLFNPNLLKTPRNRHNDTICDYPYKGPLCYYAKDEFKALSEIDLQIGGDGTKIMGWTTKNITTAGVSECSIHKLVADHLSIRIASTLSVQWFNTTTDAPWVYQLIKGDTDFEYEVGVVTDTTFPANEDREQVGMVIAEDVDSPTAWVYFGIMFESGVFNLFCSDKDFTAHTIRLDLASTDKVIKMVKVGNNIKLFSKLNDAATYGAAAADFNIAVDLTNSAGAPKKYRMGIVASTRPPGSRATDFRALVDFARLLVGGEPTCDRTLGGVDGCIAHNNERRFGATPGIIHGPLNL